MDNVVADVRLDGESMAEQNNKMIKNSLGKHATVPQRSISP